MGALLPELSRADFESRLSLVAPRPLQPEPIERMWAHYRELARWNRRLSLVGPGTADEVVERHFGEALAALPWLEGGEKLLDVGSGGGFPGLVLAAAGPALEVTVVEARERKWSFLSGVVRRARLEARCLNARVSPAPGDVPASVESPERFDIVAWRAVRLPVATVEDLARRCYSMWVWCGREEPVLPAGWRFGREQALAGAAGGETGRRIVEMTAANDSRPAAVDSRRSSL